MSEVTLLVISSTLWDHAEPRVEKNCLKLSVYISLRFEALIHRDEPFFYQWNKSSSSEQHSVQHKWEETELSISKTRC